MDKGQDILRDIHLLAESTLPKGSKVWLYGSRARGAAREDSDWDLLLLVDKERVNNVDFDEYSYPFISLGWEKGETISPILYTNKQWEEYSFTPFYKNVESEKVEIL